MTAVSMLSKCDSKGRVVLPDSIRDGLPDEVVVARSADGEGCLVLNPNEYGRYIAWLFDERLEGFNIVNPQHLALFTKECATAELRRISKRMELSLPADILQVLPPGGEVAITRVDEAAIMRKVGNASREALFEIGFGIAKGVEPSFGGETGLYGSFKTRFDQRRRIRIPSRFRSLVPGRFVAFPSITGSCLMAMRGDFFDFYVESIFDARFGGFDREDRSQLMLRTHLKARAFDCRLGKNGVWTVSGELANRILTPGGDAVIVGCGNHLEIYDEPVFGKVILDTSWWETVEDRWTSRGGQDERRV